MINITFNEMKEAWIKQVPVILHLEPINPRSETDGDYEYKRIIGYSKELTNADSEIQVTVKLEDKCGHSVTYADPKDLRVKDCKANACTN